VSWILVLFAALAVAYLLLVAALLVGGRRVEARAVAGFIPDCIVFLSRIARDPCVPRRRGLVLLGLVAYLSSPVDLIPDFIPGLGHLDDAILVVVALRWTLTDCDRAALDSHWPGPQNSLRLILRIAGTDA
jgi:uncharacterized membrane protein YkvA (DUF1232 family)